MNFKPLSLFVLGFVGAMEASLFGKITEPPIPTGTHPYLLLTGARIAAFKERLTIEPGTAAQWTHQLAAANQALARAGAPGRAIEELELAYRMTGDRRYGEPIRQFLLGQIKRPNWGEADLLRRDPPWHATLATARDCAAAAQAFDAIHDYLSSDEREKIAAQIVALGIRPTLDDWVLGSTRIHAMDTMGHNWWSACVFSAGLAAIAVYDEVPEARAWLARISDASVEWFRYSGSVLENKPANFDPEGGFYESVNYASFAMSEYLLFRLAWCNAFGKPPAEIPGLAKTGKYFVDVAYPNSGPMMTLNFGDGSIHSDGSRPLCLLWANGYRDPSFAWYLKHAQSMSYREGMDRASPLGLLYFPTDAELAGAPGAPGLPASADYRQIGWAMLRSSWKDNATLLGIKSGYTWNHSHADEGSFILFHQGVPLLVNSGNCSYDRPEYDSYYRQSVASNVVTFNGEGENPEDTYFGSKFPGSVSQLIDVGELKYVLGDATGPNSRNLIRNYRHFLWLGDVILIIDDVESFVPGQFEWLLHTAGTAVRHGLDLTVSNGNAQVLVRPLFPETFPDAGLPADFPEKMRLVEKTGLKDHDPDTKVPYYAFAPAELTRRTKFVTAITLVDAANRAHLPTISRIQLKNTLGVRIAQNGTVTDVYLNLLADNRIRHRNANSSIAGWETDAYLLAFTRPASSSPEDPSAVSRYFVADGSYLRRGNDVYLDSLSKLYATWTNANSAFDLVAHGQPALNPSFRANGKPSVVRINGSPAPSDFDAGTSLLSVEVR